MRLIDAEDYLYRERPVGLSDELYEESHLYKSIMEQEVVQAIPLDKVKQAREYMGQLKHKNTDVEGYRWWNNAIKNCLHEIDRLIESEDE